MTLVTTGVLSPEWLNVLLPGCLFDILPRLPAGSINAVITSPPYAQQRQRQYGGIAEADYPAWTVKWMTEIRRVLTDDGNVAIIIRPHLKDCQISDYLLHTRLAVRQAGWLECDELIWIKPTSPPLGHVGRPRRSWESVLWFAKTKNSFCDPCATGVPSRRLGLESTKGMGDYLHDRTMRATGRGIARCRDYVEVPTHQTNKDDFNTHPAQFPEKLAEWLIRLLCPRDGVVLDPFAGSGSTLVAASKARYAFCGTEINTDYARIGQRRLDAISHVADELICVG